MTDAELLVLLEGDVSDVDLDKSEDELDLSSDRNEHAVPTSPVVTGLEPEMIEVQVGDEAYLEDVPFSLHLPQSLSGMQKYNLCRGHHAEDQDVTFVGV